MAAEPVPADPGWDDDPAWSRPDPVLAEDREAWLDHLAAQDEPFDPEEWLDPEGPLGARDRLEAHVAARKLAMVAELIRPASTRWHRTAASTRRDLPAL